jgi:outer membrane protein assembly factor BamB
MTAFDRDALIRLALTPDEMVHAPADLGDEIQRAVRATPQRRARFALPRLGTRPQQSPVYLLLLLMLLLVLLVGSFVVLSRLRTPPPQLTMYHGGSERTGVMPGPGPQGNPIIDWQASRNGALGFLIMPVVADGRVFVADDSGTVGALDEASGEELWSASVGSPIRASPVVVDGAVVVGSDFGDVAAFRAGDGAQLWRFATSGPVSAAPAAIDSTVYIGGEDGFLYALDAVTGDERWSILIGAPVTRGPAISDGVIYIGAQGGLLTAIDADTRVTLWSVALGDGAVGTPALADGSVYVGRGIDATTESAHDLVALSAGDGSVRWTFASATGEQVHLGAVGDDLAYAVSEDNSVYALERGSGAIVWSHATDGKIGSLASLVDGTLYVSSTDGSVRALDAKTGALHWSVAVEGAPTMPAVINGRVIVGTTLGKVVAIAGSADRTPSQRP